MPIPTSITDLSTTASSNSPAGGESPTTTDDYIRALSAIIKTQDAAKDTAIALKANKAGDTFTGAVTVQGNVSTTGDITLTGTGKRITGDFSNATPVSRVVFQTSILNSATSVGAIPSGTGSTCSFAVYNSSSPDTTTSFADFGITSTQARIRSGHLGSGTALPLVFNVNSTDCAYIDTNGNFVFGSLAGSNGNTYFTPTNSLYLSRIDNAGNGARVHLLSPSNSSGWYMRTAGTTGSHNSNVVFDNFGTGANGFGVSLAWNSQSWSSVSDERKKDIIEPISNGLNKVKLLRSVIGKFKTEDEGVRRSFLIAQDVKAVLPEAVTEDADGTLQLRYTEVIPLLVAAIKELSSEVDLLKNK